MIYYIEHTTSTNDEVRNPKYGHLDAVWAEHQSAGRGQRGHTWHSQEGENITFSVVLTPTFLPIQEQFLYSQQKQDWELTMAQIMYSLLPNSGNIEENFNIIQY